MCVLTVRKHFLVAKTKKLSTATIFGDWRSGCYPTVREVVVGGECHAEVLHTIANTLGLPRCVASDLINALDWLCLLRQARAPKLLATVAEEHITTHWVCCARQ